jgi:hypothetical protein
MAANATFALKPGVWFLRVRFVIFAPDSRREPSPPSGRKSTQPTVQILEASSLFLEISWPQAASFDPAEETADQVQTSPRTVASALIVDEKRRVELDELSVGSTLQASE